MYGNVFVLDAKTQCLSYTDQIAICHTRWICHARTHTLIHVHTRTLAHTCTLCNIHLTGTE